MTTKRTFLAAAFALAAASLTALPALAQDPASVIQTIKERGTIKIGLSEFAPWAMRDKNGELIGFELDVGRQLAADMGVEAEFIPTAWDGIIPALIAGKFDVIISGMSITAERNLTVNFSDPYAYSGLTVMVNKTTTAGKTLEQLNDPSVTFAARRGATPATVIAREFPNATLVQFDEDGAATQEVLNGNANATMGPSTTNTDEVAKYPDVLEQPYDKLFDPSGEAFAFRKGDPDAENFFNNWIGQQWRSGWLDARHDYWFAGKEWAPMVSE